MTNNDFKNEQSIQIEIFPKKRHKRPVSTWRNSVSSVRGKLSLHPTRKDRTNVGKNVGKSHLSYSLWDCQNVAANLENHVGCAAKGLNLDLPQGPQFHL